jgi:beta-phosphoglucomutase-like phosphatase (HAD superfamily)
MLYRAALFDFDGTLVPSLPIWLDSYRAAMHRFDCLLSEEEVIRHCFYRDWDVIASQFAIEDVEALRHLVETGVRDTLGSSELFPLALPLIRRCRELGMQTALVTTTTRYILEHALPGLLLHDQFDFVICADDVENIKPHPEPILKTLQALGRTADEVIMIGDSTADVRAGKAAGTATALFLPDDHARFYSFATLRATQPDHIFSDHRELPEILGVAMTENR